MKLYEWVTSPHYRQLVCKIDWISTKGDGIASHYLDHGSQLDVGHHHIWIHSGAGRYVPSRLLLHTNEVR